MRIGQVEVKDIVEKYGSPVYVYDQGMMETQLKSFTEGLKNDDFDVDVIYASKAFNCKAMIQLVDKMEACLDVVSGGELYTAYKAGFDLSKVYFHGNNKSISEIEMALELGVGTIVLDNVQEAKVLAAMAKSGKTHVLLRVNPGVEAHTHQYIVTADIDSKFGISIENKEEIKELVDIIGENPHLSFDGFHAHIGSQIFDKDAFVAEIQTVCQFISEINIDVSTLNLGGGFAAYYTSEDHPIPIDEVCHIILDTCKSEKEKYGLNFNKICIEPGRSIVGAAGYTIYKVGFMKQTKHKNYVFVDGGMSDNIRPALYQAKYDCVIDGKEEVEKTTHYKIAGKCCESGDVLIEDVCLPEVETNDLLIVFTTGAYGYSMASHYNKALGLPVVFCKDGNMQLVIERETYEDCIRLEKDLCL